MTKFKELQIGQWFDFIRDGAYDNSFFGRCQKISPRKYQWRNHIRCDMSPAEFLESRVGSAAVEVYHVGATE